MSDGGGQRLPADNRNPWTWGLGIALGLFVSGRCLVPMDETDLFYNLRLGEIILRTHTVPRTNLLSFTFPDAPDPNLAWIFQIVLALVYRAGGIPATVVLKTVLVVATFVLLFRVAILRGAHPTIAAAALALSAWAAEPRFVERPHLVTFLGIGILLLALGRAEIGKTRLLWALIPIGLLWANGNSCFFLAPAVLLLYAGGALLDQAPHEARRAGCVALALGPLLFATPSGAGWVGYVVNHFRMPSLRPLQEYRTAEWPVDGPFFFLVLAMLAVTLFPGERPTGQTPRPGRFRHLIPIAALALLGSRRIRFVAEFALLAGPTVAARGTQLGARLLRWLNERAPSLSSKLRAPGIMYALPIAVIVFLTVIPRARAMRAGEPFLNIGIEDDLVPWTAIHWLDAHQLRDHLYNDLEVGSALAWEGWPRHRVFQDPRINAYPAEFHALLRRSDLDRATWEALLDRFATTAALITYPDVNPRAGLFDPELWALVYRTNEALVFVRRNRGHVGDASLIEAEELPLTFRADRVGGVDAVPLDVMPRSSLLPACEWQRRLGDVYLARQQSERAAASYRSALAGQIDCLPPAARGRARAAAGLLALRSGQPQRAADLLWGLATPDAKTSRGFALVALGRIGEALVEFDESLRLGPNDAEASFGRALALARLYRPTDAIIALRAFLVRWPEHFAAPEARSLLNRLAH